MLMKEFGLRFAAKDEKSFLFEILRRVGRLDQRAMLATVADAGWLVWQDQDPDPTSGGGSGVGLAGA